MGIVLYILISYLFAVSLYTVIVRNNAMNKFNPHVDILHIVKEGLRGIAIGYLITGVIIGLIYLGCYIYSELAF